MTIFFSLWVIVMSDLLELLGLTVFRLPLKDKSRAKHFLGSHRRLFMGEININAILINVSKSIICELLADKFIAKSCWSIGPDSVVIKCNWLLIGQNALRSTLLITFG